MKHLTLLIIEGQIHALYKDGFISIVMNVISRNHYVHFDFVWFKYNTFLHDIPQ